MTADAGAGVGILTVGPRFVVTTNAVADSKVYTAFVVPTNPGPTVTIPTPVPALEVISSLTHEHSENIRTYA